MGVDIEYLVKKYGISYYVYDLTRIKQRYLEFKEVLSGRKFS